MAFASTDGGEWWSFGSNFMSGLGVFERRSWFKGLLVLSCLPAALLAFDRSDQCTDLESRLAGNRLADLNPSILYSIMSPQQHKGEFLDAESMDAHVGGRSRSDGIDASGATAGQD
jgi:hypothetical protein